MTNNKVLTEKDFEWNNLKTYSKSTTVSAEKLKEDLDWITSNGTVVTGVAGDFLVSDGNTSWTVDGEFFTETHIQLDDGSWQKVLPVQAIPLLFNCIIETNEGPAAGVIGDYVVRGSTGEIWPMAKDVFESSYSLVVD